MNSFAHYSFGAVYQWMVENIGGIKSDGPAYKKIVIAPHPGGRLTHAATTYQSIRGEISTTWTKENGKLRLSVTIPANTTAVVILPTSKPDSITESGHPLAQAEGVTVKGSDAAQTTLELGSGRFTFEVSAN